MGGNVLFELKIFQLNRNTLTTSKSINILNISIYLKLLKTNMSKLYIFDTTLVDGEQVPGCQLNRYEKIKFALVL